jgi:glycosyltransferase involved in cell wall biosynthesis
VEPKHVLTIGLSGRMGGVETFIKNITLSSDRDMVQFDFLVHDGSENAVYSDAIDDFYAGDSREHIHYIEPFKRNPIKSLSEMRRLRDGIGFRFDWVHLNTGSPAEVVYALSFLHGRTGLIAHSHTGDGNDNAVQRAARTIINHRSTYELACSDKAAEWLFGDGLAEDSLMVRNGIDSRAFSYNPESRDAIRNSLGIGDEMVIGHVGRFHEVKNHKRILTIFKTYLDFVPNAYLCLVGVGDLMDDTKRFSDELGIADRVLFLGARSDTAALYSAFDCFLMPSFYEGLPVVLVEAQASGLPVIMSDTISRDSIINPTLCTVIGLDESDQSWADAIPRQPSKNRPGAERVVSDAGFDVCEVIKSLERLYAGDPSGFAKVGDRA